MTEFRLEECEDLELLQMLLEEAEKMEASA